MALTQAQAQQAGQIADQITILNAAVASIQNALANSMTLISQNATAYSGGTQFPLSCNYPLSVADSATVLNALLTVYNNNLTALNNQLAAM